MNDFQTIWVHAWRSDSAGGFDWFRTREAAMKAYEADTPYPGQTVALFPFGRVPGESDESTADAIDVELDHCIDNAAIKKTG